MAAASLKESTGLELQTVAHSAKVETGMIHLYEELVAVNLKSGEITKIYGVDGEKKRILYLNSEKQLLYLYKEESQAIVEVSLEDNSEKNVVKFEGVDYTSDMVIQRVGEELFYVVSKDGIISCSGKWSIQ